MRVALGRQGDRRVVGPDLTREEAKQPRREQACQLARAVGMELSGATQSLSGAG